VHHLERYRVVYRIIEAWQTEDARVPALLPEVQRGDVIIGLGGPASVCGLSRPTAKTRFLVRQAEFLRIARLADVPVLSICLSHQLQAWMTGETVRRGKPVRGVQPVELTRDGQRHWLYTGMPQGLQVYQNHQDHVLSLPPSAALLAHSETCPVESVAWDDRSVSTQFHPEVLAAEVPGALSRIAAWLSIPEPILPARVPPQWDTWLGRFFGNFLYRAGCIRKPAWWKTIVAVRDAA
jgi:GMP synthase-like glutamine amidotransferase